MPSAIGRAGAVVLLLLCVSATSGAYSVLTHEQIVDYKLTDEAYATLLHKLAGRRFDLLTPSLRDNILQFYGDLSANFESKRHPDEWRELVTNLEKLKAAGANQSGGTTIDQPLAPRSSQRASSFYVDFFL